MAIGFKAIIVSETKDEYILTPENPSSSSIIYMPKSSLDSVPDTEQVVPYIYGKPDGKFTIVTSSSSDRTHQNVAGSFTTTESIQYKTLTFQAFLNNKAKDITGDTRQADDIGLGTYP